MHNYFPNILAYKSRIQSNEMSHIVETVELVEVFNLLGLRDARLANNRTT